MTFPTRTLAVLLISLLIPLGMARAQTPLRIVVPFTPGGGADQYVRQLAATLGQHGLTAVVDNKPGASGILAADAVAHARPDGQTVLISSLAIMAINTVVFDRLPYNPAKDLTSVSHIGYQPALIVGRSDLPYKNVKEMVDYARANPGKINRGSTGANTMANLAQVKFEQTAGISTTHVPFNGDTPALQALIGGSIDIHITSITAILGHVKSGKLRVLGVMDTRRLPQVPDAPTFKEMGYDMQASLWYTMAAPAATPKATVDRINQAVNQVMADPEFIAKAATMGMEPRSGSVDDVRNFVAKESDYWIPVFRSLNLPKQGY